MTELTSLLAPFSTENPCGEDLSFSSEFDRIQTARREDDAALNQGDWVADLKTSDWSLVLNLCVEILLNRSKDLRVAAWYGEALLKKEGFEGLSLACDLMQGLFKLYWDSLYPSLHDDLDIRIGTMLWFVGQTELLIKTIPITHSGRSFAYIDYEIARNYETALSKNPDLEEELTKPRASTRDIQDFLKSLPAGTLDTLIETLKTTKIAWNRMAEAVDERLGVEGPTFSVAIDHLDLINLWLSKFVSTPLEEVSPSIKTSDNVLQAPASSHMAISGPIQSRQQALQMLKAVSEYFRQTEPHSPVAHLAQKAIDWGNMSLHDWLKSVIKDGGTLGHVEELLGINPNQN